MANTDWTHSGTLHGIFGLVVIFIRYCQNEYLADPLVPLCPFLKLTNWFIQNMVYVVIIPELELKTSF